MNELLFVYGTLREPDIQTRVIGRLVTGSPDSLVGYGKSTITMNEIIYPILVSEEGGRIEGEILNVTPEELKKIDAYETDAYRRVEVELESGTKAWVYMK